jgi:hypothetical protein
MSKEEIPELVQNIMDTLEPFEKKARIAFVIAYPEGQGEGYSVFGNLPAGENKKLIIDAAIDMARKQLEEKIDIEICMRERSCQGKTN